MKNYESTTNDSELVVREYRELFDLSCKHSDNPNQWSFFLPYKNININGFIWRLDTKNDEWLLVSQPRDPIITKVKYSYDFLLLSKSDLYGFMGITKTWLSKQLSCCNTSLSSVEKRNTFKPLEFFLIYLARILRDSDKFKGDIWEEIRYLRLRLNDKDWDDIESKQLVIFEDCIIYENYPIISPGNNLIITVRDCYLSMQKFKFSKLINKREKKNPDLLEIDRLSFLIERSLHFTEQRIKRFRDCKKEEESRINVLIDGGMFFGSGALDHPIITNIKFNYIFFLHSCDLSDYFSLKYEKQIEIDNESIRWFLSTEVMFEKFVGGAIKMHDDEFVWLNLYMHMIHSCGISEDESKDKISILFNSYKLLKLPFGCLNLGMISGVPVMTIKKEIINRSSLFSKEDLMKDIKKIGCPIKRGGKHMNKIRRSK